MASARNRSSVVSTDATPKSSGTTAAPSAGPPVGPPRYKTVFITWLAVYPTLTLLLELFGDDLSKLALPLADARDQRRTRPRCDLRSRALAAPRIRTLAEVAGHTPRL
jgi:hypothetical protein